jgi:hypothetical protein
MDAALFRLNTMPADQAQKNLRRECRRDENELVRIYLAKTIFAVCAFAREAAFL